MVYDHRDWLHDIVYDHYMMMYDSDYDVRVMLTFHMKYLNLKSYMMSCVHDVLYDVMCI